MSDDHSPGASPVTWQPWHMAPLAHEPQPLAMPDAAQAEARRKQAFQRKLELQALRDNARQEAQRLGHAAGFTAGQKDGYAEGLLQGRAAGEEAMQVQIEQAVQPLLNLGLAFAEALRSLDATVLEALVQLAMDTARQLAGEALQANPEHILERVRELLRHEPALAGKPRLWLHPGDLACVQQGLGTALAEAGWSLHADPALARGGCRVASAQGELDATLETTWARLERDTRQALGESLASEH